MDIPRFISSRSRRILVMRFDNKMTYQLIASHFGLSMERIRQILARDLRKIDLFKHGAVFNRSGVSYANRYPFPRGQKNCIMLSVRACNCLREAGISSVKQLSKCTATQLLQIRNFGLDSLKEVELALQCINNERR